MSEVTTKDTNETSLSFVTKDELAQELGFIETNTEKEIDPEISKKADSFVDAVMKVDLSDESGKETQKALVEAMGSDVQRASSHRSKMLQQPIKQLAERGGNGGPVAIALMDLKREVDDLNPNDIDFSMSGVGKLLSKLPFVGTRLEEYFLKYSSAQELIDQIIKSLEHGREQLKRDNITLGEDQQIMRKLTLQLDRLVELGKLLDQKLSYKIEREIPQDDPRYKFLSEELLFPLRQRIMDMQQQLVVNQQGVLSIEMIIRNNKELIRGVDRAINVTVSALSVAVTVALALANQELVLDKINKLNATTSNLISGTASRLRTQGAEIHKMAAESSLNLEDLKSAFNDINAAMEDISNYRMQALPKIASQIDELSQLSANGEEVIRKMERGNCLSPKVANLNLDV